MIDWLIDWLIVKDGNAVGNRYGLDRWSVVWCSYNGFYTNFIYLSEQTIEVDNLSGGLTAVDNYSVNTLAVLGFHRWMIPDQSIKIGCF